MLEILSESESNVGAPVSVTFPVISAPIVGTCA